MIICNALNAPFLLIRRYLLSTEATAAAEAALLIPALMTMLFGIFDVGTGILIDQKTITASQVAADLVGRVKEVSEADIDEIVSAAKLSFAPYKTTNFGIDIASVQFVADGEVCVLGRRTEGMDPNDAAITSLEDLGGDEGQGMIVVTVKYDYVPFFTQLFVNDFHMKEVAFTRGRRTPTVKWSDEC